MSSDESQTDSPLRLTRCMRCGYSLNGLPAEGVCPECALRYDGEMIVLTGRHHGTFSPSGFGTGLSAAASLLICAYISPSQMWWPLCYGLPSLVAVGVWCWQLFVRYRNGDELQCRFNRFGCIQCDVPEETLGLSNPRRFEPVLRWAQAAIFVPLLLMPLHLSTRKFLTIELAWIAVLLAVGVFQSRRKASVNHRRTGPLATAARDGDRNVTPTAWVQVTDWSMEELKHSKWFIHIFPSADRVMLNAVKMVVALEQSGAEQLRVRIAEWIRDARQNRRKGVDASIATSPDL